MENESVKNGVEVTMLNTVSGDYRTVDADATLVFSFYNEKKMSSLMFTGAIDAEKVATGIFMSFMNPETPEVIKKAGYLLFVAMMNEDEFKKRAFQFALHKLFMKAHEQRARKQDGDRENMDGCYQEK